MSREDAMEYQDALHEWADADNQLDLRLKRLLRNTALHITLLQNAIDRQCSNMSFVLNHVVLPEQWMEKFEREYVADWTYAGVTAGERSSASPDEVGESITPEDRE